MEDYNFKKTINELSDSLNKIESIDLKISKIEQLQKLEKSSLIGMHNSYRSDNDNNIVEESFNFEFKFLQLVRPHYISLMEEYKETIISKKKELELNIKNILSNNQ